MIQQIKQYMKKYHEANLWIEASYIREAKKEGLEAIVEPQTRFEPAYEPMVQQPQVVFSHADVGHNREETSRIQELYSELKSLSLLPKLAL